VTAAPSPPPSADENALLPRLRAPAGPQTDAAGAKAMDVRDVVRAVVPTYPASDGAAERAGFLDGGRRRGGRRVTWEPAGERRDGPLAAV
jgi:hypothetical protein